MISGASRAVPVRLAWRLGVAVLLASLSSAPRAVAQTEAHYSITAVSAEQLNNAVRIKLVSDGTISANIHKWWGGGPEPNYYLDWELVSKQTSINWAPECYPKVDRIRIHLDNALSQVGSVTNIGKYPVSHLRLVMAPESNRRYGLDVEVVLHKRMRLRIFKFGEDTMWDAYLFDHHDPAWFEMILSSDRRSLIITVASDRLPQTRDHRTQAEVSERDRELRVNFDGDRLSIHARNALLSDVVDAVNRQVGLQLGTSDAGDRLISAELPAVKPEEFVARVADCYGLMLSGGAERAVFTDAAGQSAASQAAVGATRVPVRCMKATTAANLLPNFLLDYLRIDEEGNALLVSGSKALADKVAADLATLDRPATSVAVRALVVESSSSAELLRELALEHVDEHVQISTDAGAGGITYSTLGALPEGFEARLRALAQSQAVRIRSESTVSVISGETGDIFAGLDKYVLHQFSLYGQPVVEPVSAGVKLTVTPWAGEHIISMRVAAEVKSIDEIDPITRQPGVSTRAAEGAFQVRPGETVMIGGLLQAQTSVTVRKLPILGDLPLVGGLFRAKRRQQTASEVTVLLTPTLGESSRPASTLANLVHDKPGGSPGPSSVGGGMPVMPRGVRRTW
jgi:type II secretory pathway component GspD/PulD (secretin)